VYWQEMPILQEKELICMRKPFLNQSGNKTETIHKNTEEKDSRRPKNGTGIIVKIHRKTRS